MVPAVPPASPTALHEVAVPVVTALAEAVLGFDALTSLVEPSAWPLPPVALDPAGQLAVAVASLLAGVVTGADATTETFVAPAGPVGPVGPVLPLRPCGPVAPVAPVAPRKSVPLLNTRAVS